MISVAEVVSDPTIENIGGVLLYSAEGDVGAPAKRMRLLCLPAADGDWSPVQKGDRVLVGLAVGVAYVLRVFVTNAGDAGSGLHRYIQPPEGRAGGGEMPAPEVRIGARAGGSWEAVMLYATAHADILSLEAKIDALASFVSLMTATAGPAFIGSGATAAVSGAGTTITGGAPSSGLEGRPA